MEDTPRESPRTSEHVWGWLGNLHERLKKLEEWQRRFDEPEPNDEDDEPKLEEQP